MSTILGVLSGDFVLLYCLIASVFRWFITVGLSLDYDDFGLVFGVLVVV